MYNVGSNTKCTVTTDYKLVFVHQIHLFFLIYLYQYLQIFFKVGNPIFYTVYYKNVGVRLKTLRDPPEI